MTQHSTTDASPLDHLKAWLTYCLPHHLLSRLMYLLTRCQAPWLKDQLIRRFIAHFQVDMSLAQFPDPQVYRSFNEFFTRALRAEVRPIAADTRQIISPVDGAISQLGDITASRLFQAKGHDFSLLDLLGGDVHAAEQFENGRFATLYLSPRDYHRIHMPLDGRLLGMTHVPGRLFSVNQATTRVVPRLFARNERVVAYFETAIGPLALVMVGAMFVSSIETVWAGAITPPGGREIRHWRYAGDQAREFRKGDEIARFNMGSTVIQLHSAASMSWLQDQRPGSPLVMGQAIATCLK